MNWNKLGWSIGLIFCLAVFPVLAGSAHAQKPIELAFALHTAPGGPDHEAVQKFKQVVETQSKGRLKVNMFPGGQLGGERDNLEQLKQGEVALTQSGGLDISLLAPEYAALSTPYVFPTIESVFKAWEGPIGKGIKDTFLSKGKVHVLGYQRRGARMLTAKKEIKTPDGLKGLKLRLPEIPDWVAVWKELGALPTVVAWPEVFGALQTGVVDAQENPLYLIYTTKLYEVQSHVMLTSHIHNTFDWLMSDKVLTSLPQDLKDLVVKSAKEASQYGDKLTMEQEEGYKKQLSDKGMKVVAVDVKAYMDKTKPAVEKLRPKWAPGVYEEVQKITGGK
ncbi:MAG TPA: TRAP transporter substrate-binding protein [Thermodesulfobacteriota bacterium]|nr:TRAP transporter substrate-binding protein [Thermodesulfobacteriota bacterium]